MIRKLALLLFLCLMAIPAQAEDKSNYLYLRDVTISPYQNLREFFDLPEHPGNYGITLVSDAIGPLTFKIIRVDGDHEEAITSHRSYSIRDHELHVPFPNENGKFDLIVEMANSNPASKAKISVIVVEEPSH